MKIYRYACQTGQYKKKSNNSVKKYGLNSCACCAHLRYMSINGDIVNHSIADRVICMATSTILFEETDMSIVVKHKQISEAQKRNKEKARKQEAERLAQIEEQKTREEEARIKHLMGMFVVDASGLELGSISFYEELKGTVSLSQLKADCELLTKESLGAIIGELKSKTPKQDLIGRVMKSIWGNEILLRKFYKVCAKEFSLHPSAVEGILRCSSTERKEWTEKGYLTIVGTGSFYRWGSYHEYPVFDRYQIYSIAPAMMDSWREQKKSQIAINLKRGMEKAKVTKQQNTLEREHFKTEWRKTLVRWFKEDATLGVTLQLAYWTVWVSRWAKEYQLKAQRAIRKSREYSQKSEEFNALKNEALKQLVKSVYTNIGFYRSENPHKITLDFCDSHYDSWRELKEEIEYMGKWDYFNINRKIIQECPDCIYIEDKDYYSLYFLEVMDDRISEYRFSFHTPYPIGKEFFPPKQALKNVVHAEQMDSIFRFGRALFENEKVIYTEKTVRKQFQEAIVKYEMYFPVYRQQ